MVRVLRSRFSEVLPAETLWAPADGALFRGTYGEVGLRDTDLGRAEFVMELRKLERQALESMEPVAHEQTATGPHGRPTSLWIEILLAGEGGTPYAIAGVAIDITDRKRAEQEHIALEAARQANRAKDELLSRISHELRTPLDAILGFTHVMEYDGIPGEHAESLAHIKKAGEHLLGLVNDLLDVSRIESGNIDLAPEAVPVDAVVREALGLAAPIAEKRGVSFRAGHVNGCVVTVDRRRLRQVVLNLVTSGVKYNTPGRAGRSRSPHGGRPMPHQRDRHRKGNRRRPRCRDLRAVRVAR